MSKITETNQQYYQGAQPFLVTAVAGQTAFVTTFDTDLIFGSSDPTDIDYALNNFKVYGTCRNPKNYPSISFELINWVNSSIGSGEYAIWLFLDIFQLSSQIP